jgi:hypothetical protein
MTYELVPPEDYQRTMAEKVIQTFKDKLRWHPQWPCPYFPFAPLVTTFPAGRAAASYTPKIATSFQLVHVYGHCDYNKHPFFPIRMEALVHDKPHKRHTYAEHCKKAFVLGMSTEHY